MYISINYIVLPHNIYEIHIYHNFGIKTFALKVLVDITLYNGYSIWGSDKYSIGPAVGPNKWWQRLTKKEPASYYSVRLV